MRTDYVSGPDKRTITLVGNNGGSAHCWHIYGWWPNRVSAVGIVHAEDEDEAREIVGKSGLSDFEVMFAY